MWPTPSASSTSTRTSTCNSACQTLTSKSRGIFSGPTRIRVTAFSRRLTVGCSCGSSSSQPAKPKGGSAFALPPFFFHNQAGRIVWWRHEQTSAWLDLVTVVVVLLPRSDAAVCAKCVVQTYGSSFRCDMPLGSHATARNHLLVSCFSHYDNNP